MPNGIPPGLMQQLPATLSRRDLSCIYVSPELCRMPETVKQYLHSKGISMDLIKNKRYRVMVYN